ncbi:MAG: twin transmembrane helix small protein [Alphaproteobacteria bacterium]
METLSAVFPYVIGLALAAVLAALAAGIVAMVRGGEYNKKYANKLMRWRVGLQALALVLFALFMLAIKD